MVPTNNKAEAKALKDLVSWVATNEKEWAGNEAIVIYGDS